MSITGQEYADHMVSKHKRDPKAMEGQMRLLGFTEVRVEAKQGEAWGRILSDA